MHIEEFQLERLQAIWENRVKYNLTESGIHLYTLRELLTAEETEGLLDVRLGYGWTNGEPELREIISSRYPGAGREEILVADGSAEANFLAMWSLLESGDEIVLMLPNYMQIWGIARSLGVEVKAFRLREENGWAPDLAELREQVTERTKVIAVCDPNNPTGAVLSHDQVTAILEAADRVGAYVYADEVYKGAELDGQERPTFFGLYDRVIVAAGLSKALATQDSGSAGSSDPKTSSAQLGIAMTTRALPPQRSVNTSPLLSSNRRCAKRPFNATAGPSTKTSSCSCAGSITGTASCPSSLPEPEERHFCDIAWPSTQANLQLACGRRSAC